VFIFIDGIAKDAAARRKTAETEKMKEIAARCFFKKIPPVKNWGVFFALQKRLYLKYLC